jgi:hypothetical protein
MVVPLLSDIAHLYYIIERHNVASVLIVQALQRDHAVPTKLPTLTWAAQKTIRARPRFEKHCQQNTALLVASKTNSTCFKSLFLS